MKNLMMFVYSIVCYSVGFVSLLLWILSVSHLVPEISIDRVPELPLWQAILVNVGLIALFGLHHSVTARKPFKKWLAQYIPEPIERSTFVLIAGLLLSFMVFNWQPLGGQIWSIEAGTPLYYTMYVLFFAGWSILFISTFLINHFDLFGLRQTFLQLQGKPYTPLQFRITAFYKYVRHPLYLGGIIGLWATPVMTATHLSFAILLTSYFIIGALFEEKDLNKEFPEQYKKYSDKTPMLIPFSRSKNTNATVTPTSNPVIHS